jgi:hypothetical protein
MGVDGYQALLPAGMLMFALGRGTLKFCDLPVGQATDTIRLTLLVESVMEVSESGFDTEA